jgi:hypothetical protein
MNHTPFAPSGSLLPVTISLTAIRSRIHRLEAVIQSLRAQTVQPGAIFLSLSEDAFALDEGVPLSLLPEGLRRMVELGQLNLLFVPNTGPYRKLLPILERAGGREFLVATADDDTIYPPDWLEGLVRTYDHTRCVVAYRCRAMRVSGGRFAPYHQWHRMPVDKDAFGEVPQTRQGLFTLPTGVHGVLYNSRFFPDFDLLQRLRQIAPLQDDLTFRAATMCHGIKAVRVADAGVFKASGRFRNAGTDSETLFSANKSDNNQAWSAIIEILQVQGRLDIDTLLVDHN